MTDPLSLIALGAAVGGAASKFVDKAWDSGEKWLTSYFADHNEKSQEKARQNTFAFLADLARRVEGLEKGNLISAEAIASAQDHPDFSVVLRKAMISASQTESAEKHVLLSRLVAERIKATPESMIALASKMACDAISFTTSKQLRLLGLATNIGYIKPSRVLSQEEYVLWLQSRFGPFADVLPSLLDYMHLEALSCLKCDYIISRDIRAILTEHNDGVFGFEEFERSEVGKSIMEIWNNHHLKCVQLTSIGQMIGVMVSDQVTGAVTQMSDWQ